MTLIGFGALSQQFQIIRGHFLQFGLCNFEALTISDLLCGALR